MPDSQKPSVLAVIGNHDFSSAADDLKARLHQHYETRLIDSGSPQPPKTADILLPNWFYTGLWNEAVNLAIRKSAAWLMFVASDVQIDDTALLARCAEESLGDESVGIYTPSLSRSSRASFDSCYCRETGGVRECYLAEGFFFFARTELLAGFHPMNRDVHKYGWGIDFFSCYQAYRAGYKVVADDRVCIYHPAAVHTIDRKAALAECGEFIKDQAARRFLERVKELVPIGRGRESATNANP